VDVDKVVILLVNEVSWEVLVTISSDNPVDKDIKFKASDAWPELIRLVRLPIIEVSTPVKSLEKLSNTHYIVHAHGNNYGSVVNKIPDVIELTYVNKNCFNLVPELNTIPLPITNLDFPNKSDSDDINLNFYPFLNIYYWLLKLKELQKCIKIILKIQL
jgi:uncharacterized protein (UPF0147 family)